MIELRNREQLRGAIERARRDAGNLIVRVTASPRQYRVTSRVNGNTYLVNFYVYADGRRFCDCTCMAGQNEILCKHVAAAAALNICLAEQGLLNGQAVSAA